MSGALTSWLLRTDTSDMGRRVAINEVLDKHQTICPHCKCPEAVVLLDATFQVYWQCVDCESRWPASEEESNLLLDSRLKTVH
jgi:hypothetical protein